MKLYLDGVLVVEGKEDASYLSNYISSEIVVVNGFELSSRTIEYLKNKRVIALLDPDDAGEEIRKRINKTIPNVANVYIDINKCNRGFKNGVAECEIEEIMAKLQPFYGKNEEKTTSFSTNELYKLGLLNSVALREYVCDRLNLGHCNGKQLHKRLVLNNIDIKSLTRIIEEYQNGN